MIKIRDIEIGSGLPKICVPLAGSNPREMLEEAAKAKEMPCDILEIRADYMLPAEYLNIANVSALIDDIHEETGLPVIYTVRTVAEGGWSAAMERREYLDHIRSIAAGTQADIIDCEAFNGDEEYEPERISLLCDMVRKEGKYTILSSHDFSDTLPVEELVRKYCAMDNMQGDILKIAVTPRKPEDVYTLLEAARIFHEEYSKTMIVAISMGETGQTSRICGGEFGSVITFAAGVRGTAPGQMKADKLKQALDEYYR
ncbi:MAG: type I 3-dehydroquinate dehydratase [Eubacteriaceae bacterium]|jgi:3-dehydroquinate dehydratase-1|nr:type I 3-dehydroquinate dehydratase [Eubacteriaceae bacterium]